MCKAKVSKAKVSKAKQTQIAKLGKAGDPWNLKKILNWGRAGFMDMIFNFVRCQNGAKMGVEL